MEAMKKRKWTFLFTLIFSTIVNAQDYSLADDTRIFSGRISKINRDAKLIRIKIEFENAKYLTKNSRIDFWNESYPDRKCRVYLKGRTSEYLLARLSDYESCIRRVPFAVGSYLKMSSPDFDRNLEVGKELVKILHKKRTALNARKSRYEKDISVYIEKIDATNKRYEVLRQKLDLEWQKELSALEEDKLQSFQNLKDTTSSLNDIDYKLQQYRIRDQNLVEDRWSLVPKLYYKK